MGKLCLKVGEHVRSADAERRMGVDQLAAAPRRPVFVIIVEREPRGRLPALHVGHDL